MSAESDIRLLTSMLKDADALAKEMVETERKRAAKAAGDYLREMFDQPGFAAEVERAVRVGWTSGDGPMEMSLPEEPFPEVKP